MSIYEALLNPYGKKIIVPVEFQDVCSILNRNVAQAIGFYQEVNGQKVCIVTFCSALMSNPRPEDVNEAVKETLAVFRYDFKEDEHNIWVTGRTCWWKFIPIFLGYAWKIFRA